MRKFIKHSLTLTSLIVFIMLITQSIVSADVSEIQKQLDKKLQVKETKTVLLAESLGDYFSDIRIMDVTDDGICLLLLSPTGEWETVLAGFDGSIFKSPILFHYGMAAVQAGEKWGYINEKYQWIIPPVYDEVYEFNGCQALVRMQQRYMLIDGDGKITYQFPENAFVSMINEDMILYNVEQNWYLWKESGSIPLIIPQDHQTIIFEEPLYREGRYTVVGEEIVCNEAGEQINTIYHVFDSEGTWQFCSDIGKIADREELVPCIYKVLNNGNILICFSVEGQMTTMIYGQKGNVLGKSNIPLNPLYLHSFEDTVWIQNTCYDSGLKNILSWKMRWENDVCDSAIVGSGANYMVFLPVQETIKTLLEVQETYLSPGKELVVVIGNNGVPKDTPHVADNAKVEKVLSRQPEKIAVYLNGQAISFDVCPMMENDRVMVPMRGIFEAMQAEVIWDDVRQCAIAQKDGNVIEITIGSDRMQKNGNPIELDIGAKLIEDRTLVPLRAVSEALDAQVEWVDAGKTVVITTAE